MDRSLTDTEKNNYVAWLHSPSVSSRTPDEGIIAFKLGCLLHVPPSRVLKALRGVPGVDPQLCRTVEEFVADDPTLHFVGEAPDRLISLQGAPRVAR